MNTLRHTLIFAALIAGCGSATIPPGEDAAAFDAVDATPDVFDAGPGCAWLSRCIGPCADQACVTRCRSGASADGVRLLQAQMSCVFGSASATPPVRGACPNTGGGVCDTTRAGFSSAACSACATAAQSVGGACDAQVVACQHSP